MANYTEINPREPGVELTNSNLIDALKSEAQRRRRKPGAAKPLQANPERQKRCTCGTCAACIDNARWEAIFNAKFADPDYYKPRPVRGASSLDFLRPAQRPSSIRSIER
jgi:hypothetical protein